ncbi:MAG: hypothetical protein A2Z17_01200 [Gammaproteobacteria bacterium RBG_16_66_13]|nr:MAG: hypothetical protein A2Z17_01200 [Gammaproteobacteria bacterium RBG_16_66_13]
MTPADVSAGSKKYVWWKCPRDDDHEWQATVVNRTNRSSGCPRCNTGWTVANVRAFVSSLLPHLAALTPSELYVIFQQSGLLESKGRARSLGRAMATGRFPKNELDRFAGGDEGLATRFLDDPAVTLEEVSTLQPALTTADVPDASEELEAPLPIVQVRDALAVLDHDLIASADEEAAAFLVASARAKLWNHAFRDEETAVAQAQAYLGGPYATEVRRTFLREHAETRTLGLPDGYSFKSQGHPTLPNLMQRLVAVRVRDQRRYGNWSGTGAGKTLSAILATRVVAAQLTIVCCPNSVVDGWARETRRIFPSSVVVTKTWTPRWDGDGPRYLVLNYEQFQLPTSEGAIARFLEREQVDAVVIDEIHYAKQRRAEDLSQRKRLVMGMVVSAAQKKADLCVLGLSATPVINNLQEGRSLVELVTGLEHPELETRPTVANCMRLFQRLVTLGTRWKPNYALQLDERIVPVDCSGSLNDIRSLPKQHGPLELEKILTEARIPTIVGALAHGKKTLLYTHYVEGIDRILREAVADAGFKVGLFTGDDKTGLRGFLDGDVEVLIGSSAIGTGVDGLQHVCDQIVINALPWTHAEYEQLVGRVYRQGQRSTSVRVVIPATFAVVNGTRWSYCDSKLARIRYKKSVADAAVDGVVPEGNLRSPAQAQADVMAWLRRLETVESAKVSRRPIVAPLGDAAAPSPQSDRPANYGDFAAMNARWNRANSAETAARLSESPEEWAAYHSQYRAARSTWVIVPYEEVIRWANLREGYVIGDFGCGEAQIAAAIGERHVVHSFDHVAIRDDVIAGDMSHVPLDDGSLDVAVFSLSLMGANFTEYLREAHRTLKLDGLLLIWEARSRFSDPEAFCRDLECLGFRVPSPEERGPFLFIEARKSERVPDAEVVLRFGARPA